jgi:hypothetical protein
VKFCPAKTILGDFDKFNGEKKEIDDEQQDSEDGAKQET